MSTLPRDALAFYQQELVQLQELDRFGGRTPYVNAASIFVCACGATMERFANGAKTRRCTGTPVHAWEADGAIFRHVGTDTTPATEILVETVAKAPDDIDWHSTMFEGSKHLGLCRVCGELVGPPSGANGFLNWQRGVRKYSHIEQPWSLPLRDVVYARRIAADHEAVPA